MGMCIRRRITILLKANIKIKTTDPNKEDTRLSKEDIMRRARKWGTRNNKVHMGHKVGIMRKDRSRVMDRVPTVLREVIMGGHKDSMWMIGGEGVVG
jgi:hypothetical protein